MSISLGQPVENKLEKKEKKMEKKKNHKNQNFNVFNFCFLCSQVLLSKNFFFQNMAKNIPGRVMRNKELTWNSLTLIIHILIYIPLVNVLICEKNYDMVR